MGKTGKLISALRKEDLDVVKTQRGWISLYSKPSEWIAKYRGNPVLKIKLDEFCGSPSVEILDKAYYMGHKKIKDIASPYV